MAGRLGQGAGVRRAGGPLAAEMVLDGPLSLHERVPAHRVRDLVPPGGIPVSVPADARIQRPPPAGVPLHRPPDPRRGGAGRGEGTEAVGDPPEDGYPGPRDPEVRGSDALDRG